MALQGGEKPNNTLIITQETISQTAKQRTKKPVCLNDERSMVLFYSTSSTIAVIKIHSI